MQLTKLLTLTFERNVGAIDRIGRIAIGAALAFLPWITPIPKGLDYAAMAVGAMVAASGLLARCSLYYLLGYSTCPISGKPNPFLR
jgi:hypothetical protein